MTHKFKAAALFTVLVASAGIVLVALPPIPQDPEYHRFADRRTFWGIPNFWNVVSNTGFLVAATWGAAVLRRKDACEERWERVEYGFLLGGVALTAAGSAYYHLRPDDGRLVWDRLPMTLAFMSLFAALIGERIDARLGRYLLAPLLVMGTGSVVYWKATGDLRWYALVQFLPLAAIPAILALFPSGRRNGAWIWAMAGLYAVAKALELGDRRIGSVIATGGHPWKHLAAAAAVCCYTAYFRSAPTKASPKATEVGARDLV